MFRRALSLAVLALAIPSIAHADDVGVTGYVTGLQVNETSADTYLQFNGRVFIGNAKGSTEYRWGGTSCGSRVLSDASVSLLMRALDGGLRVQPVVQIGQGQAQCVVGFTVTP